MAILRIRTEDAGPVFTIDDLGIDIPELGGFVDLTETEEHERAIESDELRAAVVAGTLILVVVGGSDVAAADALQYLDTFLLPTSGAFSVPVLSAAPAAGQFAKFDGTKWIGEPAGPGSSVRGRLAAPGHESMAVPAVYASVATCFYDHSAFSPGAVKRWDGFVDPHVAGIDLRIVRLDGEVLIEQLEITGAVQAVALDFAASGNLPTADDVLTLQGRKNDTGAPGNVLAGFFFFQ